MPALLSDLRKKESSFAMDRDRRPLDALYMALRGKFRRQYEAANYLGIPETTLSSILAGRHRHIPGPAYSKLVELFGNQIDELVPHWVEVR